MLKTYYILDYMPQIRFHKIDGCLNYDQYHNPELHSTKEQSLKRLEDVVIYVTVDTDNNYNNWKVL